MRAGGLTLSLAVAGSAVFGISCDCSGTTTLVVTGSASNFTLLVPAGNYSDASANNVFNVLFRLIVNAIVEDKQTIVLTKQCHLAVGKSEHHQNK